jgi:hypothetical protein
MRVSVAMPLIRSAILLVLLAVSAKAWAARPMITDDARIVDPKSCQVESWARHERHGSYELWTVPSCNPTGNFEISVGGGLQLQGGAGRLADSLMQAKTVLRPLRTNDWGLAVSVSRSVERGLESGSRDIASYNLNVPVTQSLRDDALLLHANAGLREDRVARRTYATWGLGSELTLRERVQLIAEVYGESGSRPFVHGGLRYWLVPDRVQMDTTIGAQARFGGGVRWYTIGVRVLSPAFLP